MKSCSKCKALSDDFSPNKNSKDGLQSQCRKCQRKPKEKQKAANAAWRAKNGWKPVTEPPILENVEGWRLESKPVLGFYRQGAQQVVTCWKYGEEDEKLIWTEANSECWIVTESITHWQPLPEPPK